MNSGREMFVYHEATKHTVEKIYSSRHVLDWNNMPDPFRHYEGVPLLDLPADPDAPRVSMLDILRGGIGHTPHSGIDMLSQLFFYSASVSASKLVPASGYRYALRVNPSSGNLHPTEFHVTWRQEGMFHYRPSSHMLEHRGIGDFSRGYEYSILLTSIAWREAWKYQARAYRYCLLDAGHAAESLILCARALGLNTSTVVDFSDDELATEFGLSPDEWPMLFIHLGDEFQAIDTRREFLGGKPNQLSVEQVTYPLIGAIHSATKGRPAPSWEEPRQGEGYIPLLDDAQSDARFGDVVRRRRSALDFVGGKRTISFSQFSTLLDVATRNLDLVQLYVYVHRVDGLAPGVYRHWASSATLELIHESDERVMAAALSLSQDLAGNSCVTFSMVADLARAARMFGNRGYRYAHFEAGRVGQRLYLAATAMGFGATGIGAFYDDQVHQHLGIRPEDGQVIYHFACGYPVDDPRVSP